MIFTVVLSKSDLERQPGIYHQLLPFSAGIREDGSSLVYAPVTGKLMEFMNVIRRADLSYDVKLQKEF